jgi:hypothetical protein
VIFESAISKVWEHPLEDGGVQICFTLDDVAEHAFLGASDWWVHLDEAFELRTRVRVMASEPEVVRCADPLCGDGCCESDECTNVPAEERQEPFLLRADTVEWL